MTIDSEVIVEDSVGVWPLLAGGMWTAVVQAILCVLGFQFQFFRMESMAQMLPFFMAIWGGYFFFGLLFILRINKRFSDPTLSLPLVAWSVFTILWTAYYLDTIRLSAMMLFMSAMLVGVFSLKLVDFIKLSLVGVVGYAVVIFLVNKRFPEVIDVAAESIQWMAFVLLILGYVTLSGRIASMRNSLQSNNQELKVVLEKINDLAIKDDLTGVYNRRHALHILKQQKGLADRGAYDFVVCYLDLDHFKNVNDTYGHHVGDVVLKKFTEVAKENISDIDYCARFGGEEFVIILVKTTIESAQQVAESIRLAAEEVDLSSVAQNLNISASLGLTEYKAGENIESLLSRADEAMYQSKETGRNKVTVAY